MDKRKQLIAVVLVLAGAAGLVMSATFDAAPRCGTVQSPSGASIRVELASDAASRARGLSGREALTVGGLLLEWPDAGRHPVWMAGMQFGLDLVWLDAQDRVTGVVTYATPCTETPCPLLEPVSAVPTRAVLEIAAGTAAPLGLVPGALLTRLEARTPCVPPPSPFSAISRVEGGLR